MARKPRLYASSGFYHVILRGNNKQNLFNDNRDRTFFLEKLKKYSQELDIDVHAYCLMSNHVHILIGNASKNMSLLVQKIANSYVFYFNRKYDRCGHLFQGRFKSEPILDDVYFKVVYRYILQNCEKGGLGSIEKYKWNSFAAMNNPGNDEFVEVNYISSMFTSKEDLMGFIKQEDKRKYMEYENKFVLSDSVALNLIKKLFHISSPYRLERLPIEDQSAKCNIMKKNGLSINQIARITGISRRIIKKA